MGEQLKVIVILPGRTARQSVRVKLGTSEAFLHRKKKSRKEKELTWDNYITSLDETIPLV